MITIQKQQMRVAHYRRICYVSSERIVLELMEQKLEISGTDFCVAALEEEEIALRGNIRAIAFYEL